LAQRGAGQQRVRREQPRTSASPKVATVRAPKATSERPASKKANTPPLPDARKEQLFREFQEWQRRQRDLL
jgi:hypothetical protein